MEKYPEDEERYLRAIRARQLRERIAQAKATLGTMPPLETLLGESRAQRSYRKAIETLARLEKSFDDAEEDRRRVKRRAADADADIIYKVLKCTRPR